MQNEEVQKSILFNEEELESILDAIGIVDNNEILLAVKDKISKLLLSFRNL